MRIHCVSVVRDEADIITYSLDAALRWAHAVHVLDNGSTDGTWEILQDYAAREPRIVVAGRFEGKFDNRLRGEVGTRAAVSARSGDWWCRLDADELYVDNPREFLSDIPSRFGVVRSLSIVYYFTDVDLRAYEADPAGYVANWSPDMMRYYSAHWSEPRFVRHRPDVPWDGDWQRGSGELGVAPQRIRLRHYQYRSPPQIERRIRTRLAHTVEDSFRHEKLYPREHEKLWPGSEDATEILLFPETAPGDPLWKSRVFRSDKCHFDAHDGRYVIDWEALPAHPPGRSSPQGARHQYKLSRRLQRLTRREQHVTERIQIVLRGLGTSERESRGEIELDWPASGDGFEYRLVLRDLETGHESQIRGDSPRFAVSTELIDPFHPYEWKVQQRKRSERAGPLGRLAKRVGLRKGRAPWRNLCPYLLLPGPAGSSENRTIIEWPDRGAPAYRVLIRDMTLDRQVVVKAPVRGTHYIVDWSTLDRHHIYRCHLQAWVDERWVNVMPSIPFFELRHQEVCRIPVEYRDRPVTTRFEGEARGAM